MTDIDQKIRDALEAHADEQKQHLDHKMEELRSMFCSAFPNGDPSGHRAYHETQIEYMNARIALWKEIRDKTLVGLVWLLLLATGSAILEYIKMKLGVKS